MIECEIYNLTDERNTDVFFRRYARVAMNDLPQNGMDLHIQIRRGKYFLIAARTITFDAVARNGARNDSIACLAMHRYLHCPLSFPRMTEEFGVGSRGPGQAIQPPPSSRKFQSLFARVSQKNDDESVPAD